jgi:triacylglycerol lipase
MPKLTTTALQRITGLEPFPQPDVIATRLPVVLMHGFGIGASFRRGGHLHDQAMHLRRRGVRAFAPNVAPYNTVAVRAEMWAKRLARVLEQTGADRLSLIAHSMGGLDARYLISRMGWHDVVEALVTVSTPHRGSSVAQFALEQPEMVLDRFVDMADWIGSNVLEDGTANARQSLQELTPSHMEGTFNPAVPDHPDVAYWSYGCQAGRGTDIPIDPLFRFFNSVIYEREGVNDGIVSVRSARWGTYLGTINADHARQVGLQSSLAAPFDADSFYASIASRLATNGF